MVVRNLRINKVAKKVVTKHKPVFFDSIISGCDFVKYKTKLIVKKRSKYQDIKVSRQK